MGGLGCRFGYPAPANQPDCPSSGYRVAQLAEVVVVQSIESVFHRFVFSELFASLWLCEISPCKSKYRSPYP